MASDVAEKHDLRFTGLSANEVQRSRQAHGTNVLSPPKRDPWWRLYLEKFDDPVIRILMIAAIIALAVGIVEGRYAEGLGILTAIFLATSLAFINEYRAAREFDILNEVNDLVPVKTVRNGEFTTVPRKDLVVGDVVLLESGDDVPADGNVLDAISLKIDESSLTGESRPAGKHPEDHSSEDARSTPTYPVHKVYRGTLVRDGHGTIRLTAVGDRTEIGHIAKPATEDTGVQTPLSAQLERLSKLIGVFGFLAAALVFLALVMRGSYSGDLTLTPEQWYFSGVLWCAILVAMSRIWLPVLYDGLDFLGANALQPKWLEKEGIAAWGKVVVVSAVFFSLFIVGGVYFGLIPASPRDWLPAHAAEEFLSYFMVAVTLIVVAVPEGLAMSVTLSLAYSMRKMTAANNLVRRMHACETIGAATVICSDKTGTLTLNEMRVFAAHFAGVDDNSDTWNPAALSERKGLIVDAIAANSTAHLSKNEDDSLCGLGNPTECALLLWLKDKGIDYLAHRTDFRVIGQLTFSTDTKYMATVGESSLNPVRILHVKGAPETVMGRCSHVLEREGPVALSGQRKGIEGLIDEYQKRGMRTLGFAYARVPETLELPDLDTPGIDLIWLGFVAIADRIRSDVPAAMEKCRAAGIKVKMVTGDSRETAMEVARQAGLIGAENGPGAQMSGAEFSLLSDDEARASVESLRVLSRARPLDKLHLVRLLQENRHVVAVTGDGTNDAPALNRADVGLAMGKTGTSIAKEASDIVLLDDSFASIVNAVMWGRSLYANIQRFILFQLTINAAALGIALLGPFIGLKLPLTVTQMLWVNLIMDTFAALALATEPPHWSVMERPPRRPTDFILTKAMTGNILTVAALFLVFLVWYLLRIQSDGMVTDYELSMFFTVFVMLQFWNLFNARCLGQTHSAFHGILANKGFLGIAGAIIVGQVLITQFGGAIFRTVPLTNNDLLWAIGGTSAVLWIGELQRLMLRKRKPESAGA
ncbi:MAG: calcium-translocating P-type ATPase, PMCA-type [Thermodesulfobacteriota bacterium]